MIQADSLLAFQLEREQNLELHERQNREREQIQRDEEVARQLARELEQDDLRTGLPLDNEDFPCGYNYDSDNEADVPEPRTTYECAACCRLDLASCIRLPRCGHTYCFTCVERFTQKRLCSFSSPCNFHCLICGRNSHIPQADLQNFIRSNTVGNTNSVLNSEVVQPRDSRDCYSSGRCSSHQKLLLYYCRDCMQLTCVDCLDHTDHQLCSIDEAFTRSKQSLSRLVQKMNEARQELTQEFDSQVQQGRRIQKQKKRELSALYARMAERRRALDVQELTEATQIERKYAQQHENSRALMSTISEQLDALTACQGVASQVSENADDVLSFFESIAHARAIIDKYEDTVKDLLS